MSYEEASHIISKYPTLEAFLDAEVMVWEDQDNEADLRKRWMEANMIVKSHDDYDVDFPQFDYVSF